MAVLGHHTAVKFCVEVEFSGINLMMVYNFRRFIILISEHAQLNLLKFNPSFSL